jgi:hypothetical protein
MSGQRHAAAALYCQVKNPGTHWVEGWVGLRACLDTEARGEIFASAEDQTPVVQSVVRHYTDWATSAPTYEQNIHCNSSLFI